jgi:hypothetical protein
VAPPAGLLPLPRWAWVPLSVPHRSGTLTYRHESKAKSRTCCHVYYGSGPHLLAEGSGTAMCPMALDPPPYWGGFWCCHVSHDSRPASLLGRASAL